MKFGCLVFLGPKKRLRRTKGWNDLESSNSISFIFAKSLKRYGEIGIMVETLQTDMYGRLGDEKCPGL